LSLLSDDVKVNKSRYAIFLAEVAAASQGKLVKAQIEEFLGSIAGDRTNGELRADIAAMVESFPKVD
jgi:hypothetical protein